MEPEIIVPILVFGIPIIAIAGGITAGILKAFGQQRLIELAQRERIAAIERGVDLDKLPPLLGGAGTDPALGLWSPRDLAVRRSQNLMIGGLVTVAIGLALLVFLRLIENNDPVWAIALTPLFVGLALLLSAWLVRPKE